jgi:carbon storage regulator CsrA
MLVLSRKAEQQIQIGENITVTVVRVKGQAVQLGIDAPPAIKILRSELSFDPPAAMPVQAVNDPFEMACHI